METVNLREEDFMMKKQGFTLAEVLITLGIIGVVAAITMPILITNMTERKNSERHANIAYKVTQAMETMRAHGLLNTQYASTEAFVDELQKYLKISKRCDKDHLTDCWPTETVTNRAGEEYNVADAKTGKHLGLATETNNVALILADGAAIILNYNNVSQGMDVGDRVSSEFRNLPVGNGKMKSFAYTSSVTGPIDFIMDVNGKGKPNKEPESDSKQFDIRSLKAATFTTTTPACVGEMGSAGCVKYLGYSNGTTAVNCNTTSPEYAGDTICGPHPSGFAKDQWAGAKALCNAISGMHLPTVQELENMKVSKSEYQTIISTNGGFWTSDESDDQQYDSRWYAKSSGLNPQYGIYYTNKSTQALILCVED